MTPVPRLGFLPEAVHSHADVVEAIQAGDADRAERVMRDHVEDFYRKVIEALSANG